MCNHFAESHDKKLRPVRNYCIKEYNSVGFTTQMEGKHGMPTKLSAKQQQQAAKFPVFCGPLQTHTIRENEETELLQFFVDSQPSITTLIRDNVDKSPRKLHFSAKLDLKKPLEDGSNMVLHVSKSVQLVYRNVLLDATFFEMVERMFANLFTFLAQGDDWILQKI